MKDVVQFSKMAMDWGEGRLPMATYPNEHQVALATTVMISVYDAP